MSRSRKGVRFQRTRRTATRTCADLDASITSLPVSGRQFQDCLAAPACLLQCLSKQPLWTRQTRRWNFRRVSAWWSTFSSTPPGISRTFYGPACANGTPIFIQRWSRLPRNRQRNKPRTRHFFPLVIVNFFFRPGMTHILRKKKKEHAASGISDRRECRGKGAPKYWEGKLIPATGGRARGEEGSEVPGWREKSYQIRESMKT